MSSSSSSGASAAATFTPVSQQQQQQQMAAENLNSALQLPAPVQEEAPSDAEQLCYVHCHICDTVLVVSVPSSSLFKTVTVRCGHCSSLLTVDMRGLLIPSTATTNTTTAAMSANSAVTTSTTTSPPPAAAAHHGQFHYPNSLNILPPRHSLLDEIFSANPSLQLLEQHGLGGLIAATGGRNTTAPVPLPPPALVGKGGKEPSPRTNSIVNRPPEKRQRVPSAYNRFIKDEIQRIKAGNPDISHREAFSAAAKNWAHFPHIHFGLMPDHQGFRKTSLLPQDHQRKNGHGLLKDGLYAAAAAANMGVAPY